MQIKVKANRHVMGLRRGQTGWVEDSKKVQSLIRVGYLVRIQEIELPLISADFDDEPQVSEDFFAEPVSDDFGLTYNVDPDVLEDAFDLAVAEARMETDGGRRIPFDDVLDELGVTREDLDES